MKRILSLVSLMLLLLTVSGCATWDGVKKDSNKAWEATKDTSSKAYNSTKEAIHDATK